MKKNQNDLGPSQSKGPKGLDRSGRGFPFLDEWVQKRNWRVLAGFFHLDPKEQDIGRYLIYDKTRTTIARKMQLPPGTLRVYLDRLFKKMMVKDRLQFVLRLVEFFLGNRKKPEIKRLFPKKPAREKGCTKVRKNPPCNPFRPG